MTEVGGQRSEISYAQRFEDLYLMRCFGDRTDGFYIDVGSGHPVYDNVSFTFYLRGWSGITVEPNPWLAQLSEAVCAPVSRDQSLVWGNPVETTCYRVEGRDRLCVTVAGQGRRAQDALGVYCR